jgi:hypothetical protein
MDALLHEARTPAGAEIPDLKQRRACLSLSDSSQIPKNGRLQKKPKTQRNRSRPGNRKALENAITWVEIRRSSRFDG